MNTLINNQNLKDFLSAIVLKLIQEDIIFEKEFALFAPQIKDKIDSYQKNPNCTCRNDITAFCMTNTDKTIKFLEDFIKENKQIIDIIESVINENPGIYIGGKIFQIEKTEEAYRKFMEESIVKKYQFRTFSIIEKNDFWQIFFI